MNLKKSEIKKILIKINPKIKSYIDIKKMNLTDNGLLDSLMIIRLIAEIESTTTKNIEIIIQSIFCKIILNKN